MNIDIKNARIEFKKYIEKYNPNNPKIALKISHIERVSNKARQIAESLNLDEENIKLAELIGLLHDIGRFEQVRIYKTFMDKDSVNHAEYGVKILFNDGLIRKFIKDDKYDEIIKKSILNHNRGYNEIDVISGGDRHAGQSDLLSQWYYTHFFAHAAGCRIP